MIAASGFLCVGTSAKLQVSRSTLFGTKRHGRNKACLVSVWSVGDHLEVVCVCVCVFSGNRISGKLLAIWSFLRPSLQCLPSLVSLTSWATRRARSRRVVWYVAHSWLDNLPIMILKI